MAAGEMIASADRATASRGRSAPSPRPIRRVVIFTGALLYSVRKGVAELVTTFPDMEWLVIEHAPRKSMGALFRNQWRNVKKNGWRWVPYQAKDIAQRVLERVPRGQSPHPAVGTQYTHDAIFSRRNVRYLRVPDIHAKETLDTVGSFSPDLGISIAAPVLRRPLFEIPREGTINLHKGRLPHYRGMPPAFWEFHNGEPEVGCTVHRIDSGLDTGPVLMERAVERRRYSTVRGAQLALDEAGVSLMCAAVQALCEGRATLQPQGTGGRAYSKPTLRQLSAMDRQSWEHKHRRQARNRCKDVLYWGYTNLARPIPRLYLALRNRQRVIVLLYHRVNDDFRDALTVGIEAFDAQMQWLAGHHTVVSIEDVARGRVQRNTANTIVAVTFDDGYLDNYQHAVPILLRHRVPAAFFVPTGLIGKTDGLAHDRTRLGHALPLMTWEHLQRMRDMGFVIGSHTVTHVDCGEADLEKIRAELAESRATLERNLGLEEVIFAYPFGGREHITPTVRRMVRELGYAGCLSAYGGFAGGPLDPYDIKRIAMSCNFSMHAFRAAVQGFYR